MNKTDEARIIVWGSLNPEKECQDRVRILDGGGICQSLRATDYKDPAKVAIGINEVANLFESGIKGYNRMSGVVCGTDGISQTIRANSVGNNEVKIAEPSGIYTGVTPAFQRGPLEGISRTLKAVQHDAGVILNFRVRKLTPKECWRLMGFSDTDFDNAKTALNKTFYRGADRSNSQLYKQAGNSIVTNVLSAIFGEMIG